MGTKITKITRFPKPKRKKKKKHNSSNPDYETRIITRHVQNKNPIKFYYKEEKQKDIIRKHTKNQC